MVGEVKEYELILVKNDSQNKLIFDQLVPSYERGGKLNTMALVPSNHKGKAIVVKHGIFDQHGYGTEQHLEIGNESNAMSVLIDKNNHMLWSDCPSLAFDNKYYNVARPVYLSTNNNENCSQEVIVNQDGTISLTGHESDIVLGMCDNHKEVRWVKKGSPCMFIFDNAYEILGRWRLSNGVEMRYSQEIESTAGLTADEYYEWPSNEFLDGLTREEIE